MINIDEIAECKIKCIRLSKNLTVTYNETCGPQGCCLTGAQSPEASTICSQATKILKLMILKAIASVPTSNQGTTEFPAHFALLKQKCETCSLTMGKTFPLLKVNKQALFWKLKTRTNQVSSICLLI